MGDRECIEVTWAKYRHDGDRKAFNCLMNYHMPIVISTAKRLRRRTGLGNLGDFVEIGIWSLWDSIDIYRTPQPTDFTNYIRKMIRRQMIEAIRGGGTKKPT